MKRIILIICLITFWAQTFAQSSENEQLIELGRVYKDYMFRNDPDKKYLKKFLNKYSESLQTEARFIQQTITTKNDLLDDEYLSLPELSVLNNIFIIRKVNLLLRKESDISAAQLVDSLKSITIPRYELVDNYYGMLFTGIGNKNKPFNLSGNNFELSEYGLKDDVEQGIFFLKCMQLCGTNIWGYMSIPKPPNTKKALSFIKKFPKFNGKLYYQFTDLYFKDFEMVIIEDEGMQSYKAYYLNKYYETLLFHLICLNKEGGSEEQKRDLLLGSILKDSDLYKYTEYKETLESIFSTGETD
jgi:hypothetical protein